jgi:hypothetical protein
MEIMATMPFVGLCAGIMYTTRGALVAMSSLAIVTDAEAKSSHLLIASLQVQKRGIVGAQ